MLFSYCKLFAVNVRIKKKINKIKSKDESKVGGSK